MSTVTCKCKNCKQPFEARVADRKRGWARYCSKSCKALAQEKRTGVYRSLLNGNHPHSRNREDDGEPRLFANAHQFSNEDCDR